MKILKTTVAGGQPIFVDDLGLIQDNVREITSAIAKGLSFGNTAVKLYGADITLADAGLSTANYSVSAGALWYDNEIYLVSEQLNVVVAGLSQATLDSSYYWNVLSTDSELVAFYDGISRNVYNTKTMLLSTNSAGILASTVKTISEALQVAQKASQAEVIDGSISTKFVTPDVLGRQGDGFAVSYPGYTSATSYFSPSKYKNGYFQSVNVDGSFTMVSDQPYVDITLDFPLIAYGYSGGFFSIPASITASGYFNAYINLVGEFISQTTSTILRLHRPILTEGLYLTSGANGKPLFKAGTTYTFTFNTTK